MIDLVSQLTCNPNVVLCGLGIDIIGFSILGYDLVKTQNRIRNSLDKSDEILRRLDGATQLLPMIRKMGEDRGRLDDFWDTSTIDLTTQKDSSERLEGYMKLIKNNSSTLSRSLEHSIGAIIKIIGLLNDEAVLRQSNDRKFAGVSVWRSRLGIVLVFAGFVIQIIGTIPNCAVTLG